MIILVVPHLAPSLAPAILPALNKAGVPVSADDPVVQSGTVYEPGNIE